MLNTQIPGKTLSRYAKVGKPRRASVTDSPSNSPKGGRTKMPIISNENSENMESETTHHKTPEVPLVGLYPSEETGCLANLFMSEGKIGPCIYIRAKQRTGFFFVFFLFLFFIFF